MCLYICVCEYTVHANKMYILSICEGRNSTYVNILYIDSFIVLTFLLYMWYKIVSWFYFSIAILEWV